jgi:hypothetical protein
MMAEPGTRDALDFIRCCLAKRRIYWTYHVNMRLRERHLTREMVLAATGDVEVVEAYPQDKYLPSYLVLCRSGDTPLHVLFAVDVPGDNVRIVTAYPPDLAEWMPDLKTRRTSP